MTAWTYRRELRVRSLLLPLLWALLVVGGGQAQAKAWGQIEPGTSKRELVVQRFGEPSKVLRVREFEILAYYGTRAPQNTTQAQFRIDRQTQRVLRVDVYPRAVMNRALIEATYGPACAPGAAVDPQRPCFEEKLSRNSRVYIVYPALGMAVFFTGNGKKVLNFAYLPPTAVAPEPSAEAEGGGEGETPPPPAIVAGPTPETPAGETAVEPDAYSGGEELDVSTSAIEDPLKIGGEIYMLGELGVRGKTDPFSELFGRSIVDVYFDARPNDHVRGMILGRILYLPTFGPFSTPATPGADPASFKLDQLWLKFDLADRLFVTVGKQHVKWGTGRFWSPVDFLTPTRQSPLDSFDERLGTDMIRLHLPWEAANSNLYLVGLMDTEDLGAGVEALGGGVRAEVALAFAEFAASAVAGRNRRPVFGLDVSSALGPLDVFAELAVRSQADVPLWEDRPEADPSAPLAEHFQPRPRGYYAQVSAGLSFQHPLGEGTGLGLSAEGFYNGAGHDSARILPWLIQSGSYQPFYSGRYYGALSAQLTTSKVLSDSSLAVTVLGNVSDRSFLSRLDLRFQLLRDLSLEAYLAVPFGRAGGELRLVADAPAQTVNGVELLPVQRALPLVQGGLGLRVKI